jgi:hypothetical protein
MPSTTNLEGEEIVEAPGKDGKESMPEQVKRPNPRRKNMMMIVNAFHGKSICMPIVQFRFHSCCLTWLVMGRVNILFM